MPLGSMTLSSRWSQFTVRHSGIPRVVGPSARTTPVQNLAGPSVATVTRGGASAWAADEIAVRPRAASAIVKRTKTPWRIRPPTGAGRRLYGLGIRVPPRTSDYVVAGSDGSTPAEPIPPPAAPTIRPARTSPTTYLLPTPLPPVFMRI